jgi:hypothetical protein
MQSSAETDMAILADPTLPPLQEKSKPWGECSLQNSPQASCQAHPTLGCAFFLKTKGSLVLKVPEEEG